MQQIALPEYLNHIEALLEENRLAEAAAHCHFVLQQQPRHVATYRLYGRALLEQHLFDDAADIFQRVLSADPEDIVAHAGLAEIYREKNYIPQAIWHMERAFEIDPYNREVRSELTKLYGRRDGATPENLELTREALAHLYVRGGLHEQAASELDGLLAEQPDRVDLQMLRAETLWRSGQTAQAARVAQEVLDQLPNCIKANAILVDAYHQLGQEHKVDPYRQRFRALTLLDASSVEDDSIAGHAYQWDQAELAAPVVVNRLEYFPSGRSTPGDIGWAEPAASDGIGLEDVPDWLREGEKEASDQTDVTLAAEEDDVMAWLEAVAAEEEMAATAKGGDLEVEEPAQDDLGVAPPPALDALVEDEHDASQRAVDPTGIDAPEAAAEGDSTESTGATDETLLAASPALPDQDAEAMAAPEWLADVLGLTHQGLEPSEETPAWTTEAPDGEPETMSSEEALPDWLLSVVGLSDAGPDDAALSPSEAAAPLEGSDGETEDEMSNESGWLDDRFEDEPDDRDESLDWLTSLPGDPDEVVVPPETPAEEAVEETLADWLGGVDHAEDSDEMATIMAPAPDLTVSQDDGDEEDGEDIEEAEDLGWLDQLAAGEGDSIEEPPTITWEDKELAGEGPPEQPEADIDISWLDDLDSVAEGGLDIEPAESAELTDDAPPEDDEEAMAWLEQLAARQGAALEELPTVSESDLPAAKRPPVAEADMMDLADDIPDDPDEAMAWLERLSEQEDSAGRQHVAESSPAGAEAEEPAEAFEPAEVETFVAESETVDESVEESAELEGSVFEGAEVEAPVEEFEAVEETVEELVEALEADELAAPLEEADEPAEALDEFELPSSEQEALDWLFELAGVGGEPEIAATAEVVGEMATPPSAHDVAAARAEAEALVEEEMVSAQQSVDEEAAESFEEVEDLDEAMAWLEQLAARQGAPVEELPSVDALEDIEPSEALVPEEPEAWEAEEAIEEADKPDESIEVTVEATAESKVEAEAQEVDEDLEWLDSFDEVDTDAWLSAEEGVASADEPQRSPIAPLPAASTPEAEAPALAAAEPEDIEVARAALASGDVDAAAARYASMIQAGEGLPFVISDLEQALGQHGSRPALRRLLGDAYAQNGQLQKALEAYRLALDEL